jgi:hypothetical protein
LTAPQSSILSERHHADHQPYRDAKRFQRQSGSVAALPACGAALLGGATYCPACGALLGQTGRLPTSWPGAAWCACSRPRDGRGLPGRDIRLDGAQVAVKEILAASRGDTAAFEQAVSEFGAAAMLARLRRYAARQRSLR